MEIILAKSPRKRHTWCMSINQDPQSNGHDGRSADSPYTPGHSSSADQPSPSSAPDGGFPPPAGPTSNPAGDSAGWNQQPHSAGTFPGADNPYGATPPPQGGGYYYQHPGQPPLSPADERTWAIIAHLSPIVGVIISAGWLNFLGPLIVWLLYKDRSINVRRAAAGSFNFNVGLWILNAVAWIFFITIIGIPIAIVIWIGAGVALFVVHIIAAVRSANRQAFKYPLQVPILK